MKASQNDATHWQSRHKEHWLRTQGAWYLLCNGYWQRAKPDLNGMVERRKLRLRVLMVSCLNI